METSEAITNGLRVFVRSRYVPERSRPARSEYFFAYTIKIENLGSETVKLISRHWIITDAEGQQEEVQGPGVVGEQPTLRPGESFEYTSACPLSTPFGSMRGSYQMATEGGGRFDAEVAAFRLAQPFAIN
ncbi:MAG: Co2+/Mg2+ efflux protein ApaG [Proteobacteria bacterium]|nr:Co2+/Mg2+ efflux protein ApaG [Pseudomonadota bacterium]